MTKIELLVATISWSVLMLPLLSASDLSQYREFDLDANLAEIARKSGTNTEGPKTVHERPALIQELLWGAPNAHDSVKEVLFSFLDGELYRMTVHYDRYKTEGLTDQDVIEATSAIYGVALRPDDKISLPTIYGRDETINVIARWEDADWSFNLVRLRNGPSYTLAVISKSLDEQAALASEAAVEMDRQEAPQRALDQKRKADLAKAAELEEARSVNKPLFRP